MERAEIAADIEHEIEVIYDALENIRALLGECPAALRQAEAYWLAHIDGALLNQGGNLGGSFISARDTLELIQGGE